MKPGDQDNASSESDEGISTKAATKKTSAPSGTSEKESTQKPTEKVNTQQIVEHSTAKSVQGTTKTAASATTG